YARDTPSVRMSLRQRFYSTTHDPSAGVTSYINEVLSIVRQLNAIGHKPADDEVTDKILIGLDPSFSAIRSILSLREPIPRVDEITAALQEYENQEKVIIGDVGES
ncbi:hypothetical protein M422DRAFT_108713, partial [Sphaerobolus stellatus SS14]